MPNWTPNTPLVDIDGYKQIPLEFSEDDGCKLNNDLTNEVIWVKASEKSDLKGSMIRPTVKKCHQKRVK